MNASAMMQRRAVAPRQSAGRLSARAPTVVRAALATDASARPPRVILDDLPKVYAYDHCPYCVRVRLGLGLKNVKVRRPLPSPSIALSLSLSLFGVRDVVSERLA